MTGAVVYKMSGSGNDFVFVDGRTSPLSAWPAERIRAVCDRHAGVGADGLVVVEPGSAPDAVRFHFFNNDGGRAAMCGNGALCATRLAAYLELARPDSMALETDAGVYRSRCLPGDGERAELRLGDVMEFTQPDVRLQAGEREARLVQVGVPHLVVLVEEVQALPLLERGRALRFDPALGPAGANVNFVGPTGVVELATPPDSHPPHASARSAASSPSAGEGRGGWEMRTYERGVEGETLACGTGAVAAASVLSLSGRATLPLQLRTASGKVLGVSGTLTGSGVRDVSLAGEGRMVFRAILGDL